MRFHGYLFEFGIQLCHGMSLQHIGKINHESRLADWNWMANFFKNSKNVFQTQFKVIQTKWNWKDFWPFSMYPTKNCVLLKVTSRIFILGSCPCNKVISFFIQSQFSDENLQKTSQLETLPLYFLHESWTSPYW